MTLPVARYCLNFLYSKFNIQTLGLLVNALSVTAVLFFFYYKRIWEMGWKRIIALIFLFIFFVAVIKTLERPEERIHIVEYGLLGILVYRGYNRIAYPFFRAAVFVGIVGIGDEFIQWMLPNRVGEIKDIGLNLLGGIFGIFAIMMHEKKI